MIGRKLKSEKIGILHVEFWDYGTRGFRGIIHYPNGGAGGAIVGNSKKEIMSYIKREKIRLIERNVRAAKLHDDMEREHPVGWNRR